VVPFVPDCYIVSRVGRGFTGCKVVRETKVTVVVVTEDGRELTFNGTRAEALKNGWQLYERGGVKSFHSESLRFDVAVCENELEKEKQAHRRANRITAAIEAIDKALAGYRNGYGRCCLCEAHISALEACAAALAAEPQQAAEGGAA